MKEFILGFLFLLGVFILAAIGVLLFPFFILLGLLFRLTFGFILVIIAIWLLGRFIIIVHEKTVNRNQHKDQDNKKP